LVVLHEWILSGFSSLSGTPPNRGRFRACRVFSSGVVEGLNNKAKVGMRRAYGNRSDDVLEVALFHQLGALPEPPVTHRFSG
jgi:hypothetical protein